MSNSRPTSTTVRSIALLFAFLMIASLPAMGAAGGFGAATPEAQQPEPDLGPVQHADVGQDRLDPAVDDERSEATFETDAAAVDEHEIPLATGHTLTVFERGDDRRFELEAPDGEEAAYYAVDRSDGTYVLPARTDLTRYSEALFNVDLLLEQGYTADAVPGTPVIVTYDDGADAVRSRELTGLTGTERIEFIDADAGYATGDAPVGADSERLEAAVDRVYLDARHEVTLDESTEAIGAETARDEFDVTGAGVTVAVLDTGIDADHPDFGDRVVDRTDFTGDGLGDRQGHGTHVAGIVAGDGTESDGEYVGVAPEADLMEVKVLGDAGSGSTSDIADGIGYAVDEGADVISLSLGGPVQANDPLVDAAEAAVDEGVSVVVSAGNDGPGYRTISSPGNAEGAITVGATNHLEDEVADFSSSGPTQLETLLKPEVVAPGWGVTSTGSDDAGEAPYASKSGTSMSAPHVSGLAALMHESDDDLTPAELEDRLVSTADPVPDAEGDVYRQGAGQVNATEALEGDVVVHDAVTSLGVYEEATTDTVVLPVENRGDEAVSLEADVELLNVEDGEYIDNAALNRSTVDLEPGETGHVELEIDTADVFGMNAGVVTFEDDAGDSYRSVFGFTKGLEVTVDKEFNEKNTDHNGIEGIYAWSTDGTFDEFDFGAFLSGTDHTFVVPTAEIELNFWSLGEYEDIDSDAFAEFAYAVEEGVQIDQDNTDVTIDETETVERALDTSAVEHHEPFDVADYEANIHARLPDGSEHSFAAGGLGDRGHYTPIDDGSLTNVSTNYLVTPAELGGEYGALDSPYVYSLVGATETIDADDPDFVIDPETFAEEHVTFERTDEEFYSASAWFSAADEENFPGQLPISTRDDIGPDRTEQTWIRNADGKFENLFDAEPTTTFRYLGTTWSPDEGESYETPVNVGPFVPAVDWHVADGEMDIGAAWAADQGETRFASYKTHDGGPYNELELRLDGETVIDEPAATGEVGVTGPIGPGTTVDLELEGESLGPTRDVRTAAAYSFDYEADGPSSVPDVAAVDVVGYGPNEVVTDRDVTVEVAFESDLDLETVEGYYGSGATDLPGADDEWTQASLEPVDGSEDTFLLEAVADGSADRLDLAFHAVDAHGSEMTAASMGAVPVDVPELTLVDGQPARVEPGEPVAATFDVEDLEMVAVELADESTLTEEELSLSVDGTPNAFGEYRGYESPLSSDDYSITVEADEGAAGTVALETTFVLGAGDGTEEVTVSTGPTAVYESPIEVPGDVDSLPAALDLVAENDTVALADGTYEGAPISTDGVTVAASAGADPVVTAADDATAALPVVGADDVTVEGLTVEADAGDGIAVEATRSVVAGPTITGTSVSAAGTAIDLGDAAGPHLESVTVTDAETGLALEATDATATDAVVTGADTGIDLDDASLDAPELHVEAADTGVAASGANASVTTTDATIEAATGLSVADGATADVTLSTIEGGTAVAADEAGDLEVHHNDLSGAATVASSAAPIDVRLNYVGDREPGESIVSGEAAYDPFLTDVPETVDRDRTDIATDLHLEAGETYALAVPGATDATLMDLFGDVDGTAYGFDAADQSWEHLTGNADVGALDAMAVSVDDDARLVLDFRTELSSPGQAELEAGWNFVGSPVYGDVEEAYAAGTADVSLVQGAFESPDGQLGPEGELDGTYVLGSQDDGPHVSAFEGVFVFAEEDGVQPAYLSSNPTMSELYSQLGLESSLEGDGPAFDATAEDAGDS